MVRVWRVLKDLRSNKLFLIAVALPTIIAIIYYGLIASDVYVSESRFVIRSPQRQAQLGLVDALLQGSGFSRSDDDTYLVHDYILSRDALRDLNQNAFVEDSYRNRGADFVSRFPRIGSNDSFESLWKYYQHHIDVDYDATSGITTLRVRAFTANDAYGINSNLMSLSERLINRLNERASHDMIDFARKEVIDAENDVKYKSLALSAYRNSHTLFDPERQSALQLQQVSTLQAQLVATKSQLIEVQSLTPNNPQIAALKARQEALQSAIDQAQQNVAGDKTSLSGKVPEFDKLSLDKAFAERRLASAMTAFETAQDEAQRKQFYLERLVTPNKPDIATEPKRLQAIFVVFVLGMIIWGLLSLLIGGIKEHQL